MKKFNFDKAEESVDEAIHKLKNAEEEVKEDLAGLPEEYNALVKDLHELIELKQKLLVLMTELGSLAHFIREGTMPGRGSKKDSDKHYLIIENFRKLEKDVEELEEEAEELKRDLKKPLALETNIIKLTEFAREQITWARMRMKKADIL